MDANFIVQVAMGGALIAGVILANQKQYRAHAACQTTVLLLNLWMIGFEMWPSFRLQIMPHVPRILHNTYYKIATIHAAVGTAAERLGMYIVLVATTKLVPPSLRFTRWKRWMRIELAVWFVALMGLETYYEWYVIPLR